MAEFDVVTSALRAGAADAVPRPLVVEAGAGTGKTWTLAHLATRFMIEDGVEPDEVLMVTFTRDAARELRGRVRARLAEVRDFLVAERAPRDAVESHLASRWGAGADRAGDARRARHCLAGLDGLHARTIHSFAAVSVAGAAGRAGEDARLWRHATNLATSRWALEEPGRFGAWRDAGGEPVLDAVVHALYDAGVRPGAPAPTVRVLPEVDGDGPDDALAATQRDLALEVVERYVELARRAGRTSFADLLVALAGRIDQRDAARFRDELRSSYRVVMIDEFQDTDPLQWHVFRWLFADAPDTRLVVVGDPKQAIYGFRSGSVETFLDVAAAARGAGQATATLSTSYRSTPGLVDALNRLFAGADFHYRPGDAAGGPRIAFSAADAARDDAPSPLGAIDPAALHLRVAPYSGDAQRKVLDEVADYVEVARAAGVAYHEIAVLCRSNAECDSVQRHLVRRRLPAVTSSGPSIFECEAAAQLRTLLVAVESPEDAGLTEGLRATWFRGPAAADPASAELGAALAALARELSAGGVAAVARFCRSARVVDAVLGARDGERHLTDLGHLCELMGAECHGLRSATPVIDWLDGTSRAEAADEATSSRRLETESDAVRVLTVHKSKGQQWRVVLLPFVRSGFSAVRRDTLVRWLEGGATHVDAGSGFNWGDEASVRDRVDRAEAASAGEGRRLAYVAATRARDAVVLWFTMPNRTPLEGELARLLFDREGDPSRVVNRTLAEVRHRYVGAGWAAKREAAVAAALRDPVDALRASLAGAATIAVMAVGDEVAPAGTGAPEPAGEPARWVAGAAPRAALERRRWSYSAVAAALRAHDVDVDEAPGADESGEDEADDAVRDDVAGAFGGLAGTRLGVLVHEVLEAVVGHGATLDAALERAWAAGGWGDAPSADVARSVRSALARPVPAWGGASLDDLAGTDVAAELRFTLALGERPGDRLVAAAREVSRLDRSGEGDGLFADYFAAPEALADLATEGFLVGSLDLTLRAGGRYRVVDYKTDRLPGATRPHEPARLRRHMAGAHYPLQALFYAVALHRLLRSRLAGYVPDAHLGGVDYFFVRAADDASAEPGDGVLTWAITPAAVVAASDALGRDG